MSKSTKIEPPVAYSYHLHAAHQLRPGARPPKVATATHHLHAANLRRATAARAKRARPHEDHRP